MTGAMAAENSALSFSFEYIKCNILHLINYNSFFIFNYVIIYEIGPQAKI